MDVHNANSHALVAGLIALLLMALAYMGASLDMDLNELDVVMAIAFGFLAGAFVSEIQHER